jgi:pilus assembly protein CpaB
MILRVTFFALMALGLLGLGFIGYASTRPPPITAAAAAAAAKAVPVTVAVLTAAHDIPAGTLLKPADLATKQIARNAVPADATMDTEEERRDLYGAMVRRSMVSGEIVHFADALRPGDHGFLAAVLKGDMRAVTVGVDAITGTAGLIWPGDRVDLILTQTIPDQTLPIGRRIVAETVVSDVRVIAIDQRMVEGAANSTATPDARTVTLEVNEHDAQGVQVAVRLGRLSLSVRPADGGTASNPPGSPIGTTWASDISPALGSDQRPPPPPPARTIKIWQGTDDGKDFKF